MHLTCTHALRLQSLQSTIYSSQCINKYIPSLSVTLLMHAYSALKPIDPQICMKPAGNRSNQSITDSVFPAQNAEDDIGCMEERHILQMRHGREP